MTEYKHEIHTRSMTYVFRQTNLRWLISQKICHQSIGDLSFGMYKEDESCSWYPIRDDLDSFTHVQDMKSNIDRVGRLVQLSNKFDASFIGIQMFLENKYSACVTDSLNGGRCTAMMLLPHFCHQIAEKFECNITSLRIVQITHRCSFMKVMPDWKSSEFLYKVDKIESDTVSWKSFDLERSEELIGELTGTKPLSPEFVTWRDVIKEWQVKDYLAKMEQISFEVLSHLPELDT